MGKIANFLDGMVKAPNNEQWSFKIIWLDKSSADF